MLAGMGHRRVLIVGLVRSLFSMLFLNVHHMIPRDKFLDYFKKVLPLDAFEAFLHGSTFDKTAFCLEVKQGKLVIDECSSWYNRVGDI